MRFLTNCEQTACASRNDRSKLDASLRDQVHTVSQSLSTERTLSGQIMDLREMKATVREQLRSTEGELYTARTNAIRLEEKCAQQAGVMATLQNELKTRQPMEDPKTLLRLQEVDTINKGLQEQLNDKNSSMDSLSDLVRQKEDEIQRLHDQISANQSELEETRQRADAMSQEKIDSEKQAIAECEKLRKTLARAADQEIEDMKSKHLNAMQQLTLQKLPLEEKCKEASMQLILIKIEKEGSRREAMKMKDALNTEQKRTEEQVCLHIAT